MADCKQQFVKHRRLYCLTCGQNMESLFIYLHILNILFCRERIGRLCISGLMLSQRSSRYLWHTHSMPRPAHSPSRLSSFVNFSFGTQCVISVHFIITSTYAVRSLDFTVSQMQNILGLEGKHKLRWKRGVTCIIHQKKP